MPGESYEHSGKLSTIRRRKPLFPPLRTPGSASELSTFSCRRRSRRRPNSRGKGGPKPCQAAEKPQTPRQEKPQRPEGGRPQRAERPPARGEKPPRGEKGPVRVDKVEKLPVRAATDTTAEKKAAADRAARQQGGGQEAKPGGGSPHRRPRRRPRGKGEG